jgi:hypothetical protein
MYRLNKLAFLLAVCFYPTPTPTPTPTKNNRAAARANYLFFKL